MITPVVQRWRERRDLYRPAGETIVAAHYEVAAIPDASTGMFMPPRVLRREGVLHA